MTSALGFHLVDVFAADDYSGNPLAVVHDADGLSTDEMLTITRWTNLSETTFLCRPTDPAADYRVRIFTPRAELPFAGHPTLGTCAAWLDAGGEAHTGDVVVQECGAGLIKIRRTGTRLAFAAPPLLREGPVDDADLERVLAVLGLDRDGVVDSAWIDNGPGWLGVRLRDAAAVRDLPVPTARVEGFDVGIVGLLPPDDDDALEVRAFFGDQYGSIREDPVTGSLNASLAQWLLGNGLLRAPYTARQCTGRVAIDQDDDGIWVGGATHLRVTGTIQP